MDPLQIRNPRLDLDIARHAVVMVQPVARCEERRWGASLRLMRRAIALLRTVTARLVPADIRRHDLQSPVESGAHLRFVALLLEAEQRPIACHSLDWELN